jgi:hypothetical protein
LQHYTSTIAKAQNGIKEGITQPEQQLDCKVKTQTDPMTNFMYALKAKESKRQYPRRFKMFLDYLKLDGITTISEQAKLFLINTENDPKWRDCRINYQELLQSYQAVL